LPNPDISPPKKAISNIFALFAKKLLDSKAQCGKIRLAVGETERIMSMFRRENDLPSHKAIKVKRSNLMRSEIMRRGITVMMAAVLFGISPLASAEIFTVELPEFIGPLVENGTTKTATFDFGTSFLQIDNVSIQLEGTCTMGSAHGDGTWFPEDEWTDVPSVIEAYMDAPEGFCGMSSRVDESPFVIDEPFDLFLDATWDFLLDGTDNVTLNFYWGFGIDAWIIVTTPTADITDAYLVVDGIVPEPATILLLGIGAIGIPRISQKN